MITLAALTLYPIKSCGGIALSEAGLTSAGLMSNAIGDREWMVVDAQGGFLTQREHPKMALITPCLLADRMILTAPGMPPLAIALDLPDPDSAATVKVQVWRDTLSAYDCDDDTAAWFSKAIGVACRLVRFHPHARRLAHQKWTGGLEVPTLFSDGFPLLLIGQHSLDDLNQKLLAQGREALPMNRFRPNLVIDGIAAYEEDYLQSIQIGSAHLKPVKPCPRCPIPSIDQASGTVGPDPLDIMQAYRANPLVDGAITFGMNLILLEGAGQVVRVGQEIAVELAF